MSVSVTTIARWVREAMISGIELSDRGLQRR